MKIDLDKITKIHFIGIGGISMSSLAMLCLNWNKVVSGSDKQQNEITLSLSKNGIKVFKHHSKNNIKADLDLIVYTSAVSEDNIELVTAKQFNIPIIERAKFLQLVSNKFKNIIAISGTHGKTTTCGMVASIFTQAKLNPTVQIGGIMKNNNSNFIFGDSNFFITEACEYKKHLLALNPTVGVVLNMEPDHMECYKNFSDLVKCFKKFLKKSKISVCNKNYDNCINYLDKYEVRNTKKNRFDCYSFDAVDDLDKLHITLKVAGKHNIYNALCAITVAKLFNISNQDIEFGLKNYLGIILI